MPSDIKNALWHNFSRRLQSNGLQDFLLFQYAWSESNCCHIRQYSRWLIILEHNAGALLKIWAKSGLLEAQSGGRKPHKAKVCNQGHQNICCHQIQFLAKIVPSFSKFSCTFCTQANSQLQSKVMILDPANSICKHYIYNSYTVRKLMALVRSEGLKPQILWYMPAFYAYQN